MSFSKKNNVFGQYTEIIQDLEDTSANDLIFQSYEKKRQTDLDSQERGEMSAFVEWVEERVDPNFEIPYTIFCTPISTHEGITKVTQMCQAIPAVWLFDEVRPMAGTEIRIRFDDIKDRSRATFIGQAGAMSSLYDKIVGGFLQGITGAAEELDSIVDGITNFFNNAANPEQKKIPQLTLQACERISDGGRYELSKRAGSGVPIELEHKGSVIASRTPFVYCSGFTFSVVFMAAKSLKLLDDKSPQQLIEFKQRWYGSKGDTLRQQGPAMEWLGIGQSIPVSKAEPGDFCQIWRKNNTGHSVVFKGWLKDENGQIIGLKYRSAQGNSGVANTQERFVGKGGSVIQGKLFFSRLRST